ncbi:hypothetical protein BGZ99_007809 [Dissophora globulifera]|uniref:DDHD domain-containing protein n=1 Tax=Dissophora globulifera TaxID=979702 RepID=A0A9P6UYB3_9FUNG|nr:hypothetical protein BGZ99_007809 [Dissophora globulifera]
MPTAASQAPDQHPHHVIFVVHGMGRQLEEEYGNYERNVGHLVENTKAVLQNTFHELETDVHIIPIEWHAKLHSLVDDRMSLASLKTMPKVRMVMNEYLADILYYFNGHYGEVIMGMIADELNEAYNSFMAKHPDFNGKVSIFALSLGGVAMYDIIASMDTKNENQTEQDDGSTTESNPVDPKWQRQQKFKAVAPKLVFRPHYLFTAGSPVGAVLVMRNFDWETFHPPDDIIHHNLFHPFDPLGYRIEPLIDRVFADIPATPLASYSSSQLLFPSLSLLSLPFLLPESISAFWENNIPSLPRPLIPTFSSLTQMTQSFTAVRWFSGNGSVEAEGLSTSTAVGITGAGVTGDNAAVSSSLPGIEGDQEDSGRDVSRSKQQALRVVDADTSATECMVAFTAAACIDQEQELDPLSTLTGQPPAKAALSDRPGRPGLGPRRISSRVDKQQDSLHDTSTSLDPHAFSATVEDIIVDDIDDRSATRADDISGMDTRTTAQEKLQGLGAKSDVVHESMVNSLQHSFSDGFLPPTEGRGSQDTMQSKVGQAQQKIGDEPRTAVHVEGLPTKVPYRIDYVLQETTVDQYTSEYLLGMRSHFRYWGNRDIAFHLLRTILEPLNESSEDVVMDIKLDTTARQPKSSDGDSATELQFESSGPSRGHSAVKEDQDATKQSRRSFVFPFFGAGDSHQGDASQEQEWVVGDNLERPETRKSSDKRPIDSYRTGMTLNTSPAPTFLDLESVPDVELIRPKKQRRRSLLHEE